MNKENKNEAIVTPEILIWARERVGLTRPQVEAKLGLPNYTLVDWEFSKAKPTISQAQKLAEIYKIPFAAFFLPEPPKEEEKITLRQIIKGMERTMERAAQYSTVELDSLVLNDLKQLKERIEGIQDKHIGRGIKYIEEDSFDANSWDVGVNWVCSEILGEETGDERRSIHL